MTRRMLLLAVLLGLVRPVDAKDATLVIRGKLTAISSAPLCGILHTAVVARYEVKSVVSGTYKGPILYAVFDCGWVPGKHVAVGDVHQLTVKPLPADFTGSIFDDFASDKSLPRFLAVHADD